MRRIVLYGRLKEKFGEFYDFDVNSPKEAIKGLCSQVKGFKDELQKGGYILTLGKKLNIDESQLTLTFGKQNEFHIIPYVHGSGGRAAGVVKVVLGVTLLAVGLGGAALAMGSLLGPATGGFMAALALPAIGSVTYGALAGVGLALSVTGVAGLLTSKPKVSSESYNTRENAEDTVQSFLFNGAVNRASQGGPVPVCYGRFRVGSVIISAGISNG